ncbi:MAG: LysE family translocator [Kiritimatiellia bacterium]
MRRFLSFFCLSLALDIAPGPDILFVMAQSLARGWAAGALVTLGLCTGLCFHVTLAAFGVAAALKQSPRAFAVLTWCGAAYLAWLGVDAWRHAAAAATGTAESLPHLRLYLRGIVMNVCNPKVMLFFLALVPRFIVPEKGRVALQFILLGLTFAIATLLVFNGVAFCGGALAHVVGRWLAATAVFQRVSALVMFGLAAWIGWMNLKK